MDPTTEKIVNQVADGIVGAVSAIAPALGGAGPIVALIVAIARGMLSLAEQLGHGDAVRAMLDAELATARQATDSALARKHGHP